MDRQKVTKSAQELKTYVDEICIELAADSPRQLYITERVRHLKSQVEGLEDLVGIGDSKNVQTK